MSHRLLSIDGGGVRGVVALEVLARIEQVLRDETGDPDLVLGDWFDYVGGTSTGAIIAGGVALGLPDPLFSYLRYDAETHPASLADLRVSHLSAGRLDRIDGGEHLDEMSEFGRAIATRVETAHFAGFLERP